MQLLVSKWSLQPPVKEQKENKRTELTLPQLHLTCFMFVKCKIRIGHTLFQHAENVFHFLYKTNSRIVFCVLSKFQKHKYLSILQIDYETQVLLFNQHQSLTYMKLTFCCLISGSVTIAWTLAKIFLGLRHALYVGLVLKWMRNNELEIFKDRFFKVVGSVQAVIDR